MNKGPLSLSVVMVLIFSHSGSAGAQPDASPVETYQVNATVSDVAKKTFREIGSGTVTYSPGGQSPFTIRLQGTVRHPERKSEEYVFNVQLKYSLEGKNLRLIKNSSTYNRLAMEYKDRVESLAGFVYLARFRRVPAPGEDPSREYRLMHMGGPGYTLTYRSREQGDVELSVREGDERHGSFLLEPTSGSGGNRIKRFKVHAGKLTFDFIAQ
ncbi:MAG: hypothetical protein HY815_13050 [Candidatus Riflebacteria bacterium]|nr:hypothetical protein [Candidatus Riflebacteria bacterium]